MQYFEKSISEYLKQLSSKSSVPGGGSAAALVGAIGAALLSKVANFTTGKEKYKEIETEVATILSSSEKLCAELKRLIEEDALAYQKVTAAYKLPKETDEEKKLRSSSIQQALNKALEIPLAVCRMTARAVKLCPVLLEKGNINLVSDVGVAAEALACAFQSALLNVDINLAGIKDADLKAKVRAELIPLEKEVEAVTKKVMEGTKEAI